MPYQLLSVGHFRQLLTTRKKGQKGSVRYWLEIATRASKQLVKKAKVQIPTRQKKRYSLRNFFWNFENSFNLIIGNEAQKSFLTMQIVFI